MCQVVINALQYTLMYIQMSSSNKYVAVFINTFDEYIDLHIHHFSRVHV